MAIEKIIRKKGIQYRAIWINPLTKKRESACFDNELDAKQHEIKMRKQARDNPQACVPVPSNTFRALSATYLKQNHMTASSWDHADLVLEKDILPLIADIAPEEITRANIKEIERACRERGNKQNTIQRKVSIVRAILAWAVEEELLKTNPISDYVCKRGYDQEFKPPTIEERDRIFNAAAPHLKRAITISTATGVRVGKSELLDLRWLDVDFHAGTLTVRSAAKNKGMQLREMDLPTPLLGLLRQWQYDDGPDQPYIIHHNGKPVSTIKHAWWRALERAGIQRRIRPYDMRHFFASEALRAGADMKAVAELLGHADMTMILKHYQHTVREQRRSALAAIPVPTEKNVGTNVGIKAHKIGETDTHENKFIKQ